MSTVALMVYVSGSKLRDVQDNHKTTCASQWAHPWPWHGFGKGFGPRLIWHPVPHETRGSCPTYLASLKTACFTPLRSISRNSRSMATGPVPWSMDSLEMWRGSTGKMPRFEAPAAQQGKSAS